jgi:ribosomal protein S18 acetylase RimI-like enzyme
MATLIRWASVADASPIALLWHRTWHATYARHVGPAAAAVCGIPCFERRVGASLYESFSSEVARPTTLVAEQDGEGIRGFAIVRGGREIEHIYVAPEAHGTGLANKLLAAAEHTMLNERGCELAFLAVAVRNLRAYRFYERHGWVPTARHPQMSTAPWQPVRPPELALPETERRRVCDAHGGLTEEELEATRMRGTLMKKFLGYDVGVVPRRRSYPV